jgi:hypothetical protein
MFTSVPTFQSAGGGTHDAQHLMLAWAATVVWLPPFPGCPGQKFPVMLAHIPVRSCERKLGRANGRSLNSVHGGLWRARRARAYMGVILHQTTGLAHGGLAPLAPDKLRP